MIRRFLLDTADMILELLARVGLLRGGPSWWKHRVRRRMGEWSSDAENLKRSVQVEHKMCRECRALVPVKARTCPECGESTSGVPKAGAGRLVSALLPGFGSASLVIVGAIATVFAAMAIASSSGSFKWSLPGQLLFDYGGKSTGHILQFGQWWRLINPIFLHASVLHIGFNAYALANLGPVIEQMIGARRFVVVFMGTGILSFVASAIWSPGSLSVGASGALFGLIGFGIVHGYVHGGTAYRIVSEQLVRWALFGVLLLIVPRIDHAAHAGGFIAGALFGWLITGRPVRQRAVDVLWSAAAVVMAILPVAGFIRAIIWLAGRP